MEFTACGVCCHPAAPQGFLEDGLRWLLAQHSRDLSSSLARTALLKMRSNYITLLILHYLLWFLFNLFSFVFFIFQNHFSQQLLETPPSHSSLLSPPLPSPPPRETDVASVSRDNGNKQRRLIKCVSQHQVLFDKQIAKASSPEDNTWSQILIIRGC